MELGALVAILVLVWYYGRSLKIASEAAERNTLFMFRTLAEINASIAQVNREIDLRKLEKSLDKIVDHAESVDVGWNSFTKYKIDPMLQKLDEISALSVALDSIHDQLESIQGQVEAIAAHPAFTWSKDEEE